jgi:hypothetical protein
MSDDEQTVTVALSKQLEVATDINACFCIGCGQPDEPGLHDPARCPAREGGKLDLLTVAEAVEVYDTSCDEEPNLEDEARALHCAIVATRLALASSASVEPRKDTIAFVQDWLMNSDYDPTQFDKGFAAAIDARHAFDDAALTTLAERFCAAPLPDSVCADLVAIKPMAGRSGTNLMSVAEAKEVLRSIFPEAVTETNQAGEVAADTAALTDLDTWAEQHCADHDEDYIAKDDVVRYAASLRAMLLKCRDQFAFYEQSHRAKGTVDADAKALVNARMVTDINAALSCAKAGAAADGKEAVRG